MIRAKKNGFTYDDYVEQAHIINKYVFSPGLDEEELSVAIRQEEWDKIEVNSEKQLLFLMAQDVIDYWNCLWCNQQLAFFNIEENRYDRKEVILQAYLQEKYQTQNITVAKIKEVLEQVYIQLRTKQKYWKDRNAEYILCKDKLVSMLKDDTKENTRTIYTDIYYPYSIMSQEEFDNYDGRAKSFMEEISCYHPKNNPDMINVIWECLGCMLAPVKNFSKLFIWYGTGANGKSLLLKLFKKIMGDFMTHANILSVNDKFALQPVIDGVCNVTDDVGITTLKETGLLKSLVDGGNVEVNRKYKSSIWWKPNSQFIICCNDVPKIADTTPRYDKKISIHTI